ncbi:hypothetical protein VNI00_014058 [Paramarasmius palmivorus]|uniref:NodB homology domain-containing protein n=1 Tax=Paramarasmius palmivorus TaxID=297713 RepID=A0AAW0BWH4_9AGAR
MRFTAALIALSVGALAFAAPHNEKRQRASVYTQCTQPNTVALTFDDGPWWNMHEISDTLTRAGGKGTFFFNGNNWACIYDMQDQVKYAYNQGHQVASHTWSHWDLATLSWDTLHDQMWKVEQALQRIVGVTPAFMRPPFGSYNDLVRQVAAVRGQSLVNWDFDSHDGDDVPPSASDRLSAYGHLIWDIRPNTILALNHEFNDETAHTVLPQVVQWLNQRGYRMVTVAECLGMQPYQNVGQPQQNDGSWKC